MALILSIDTAMENAGLCLSENATVLSIKTNSRQTDHAGWIHNAIKDILGEANRKLKDLSAIGVTSGPGSYTGLRVGMATAKGLCYVLNLPLITEGTLHLLAYSVKRNIHEHALICPMIDARRMEVFSVLYDEKLEEQQPPAAVILDEHSFQHILHQRKVIFCGNGSEKWKMVCHHPNAVFAGVSYDMNDLAEVVSDKFFAQDFTSIAYSEPYYLKNVYTGTKNA